MNKLWLYLALVFGLLAAGCAQVVEGDDSEEISDLEDTELDDESSSSKKDKETKKVYKDSLLHVRDTVEIDTVYLDTVYKTDTIPFEVWRQIVDTVYRVDSSAFYIKNILRDTLYLQKDTIYYEEKEIVRIDTLFEVDTMFLSTYKNRKVMPKLEQYPYYSYVNGYWEYEDWDPEKDELLPPYYPELFEDAEVSIVDARLFPSESFVPSIPFDRNAIKSGSSESGVIYSFEKSKSNKYLVSIDKMDGIDAPVLRIYFDYVVRPIEYEGRWYYPIDASKMDLITDQSVWIRFYSSDLSKYGHAVQNMGVSDGVIYSMDFEVNLIVAGKYMGTSDTASVELLASRILQRLNLALNPGGISAKKINILYANNHPRVGANFPKDKEFVLSKSDAEHQALQEALGCWSGNEGVFNIILGYYVDEENVVGFSPVGGRLNMDNGCGDILAIATHANEGEYQNSSKLVADVAVHELGHFFGLRHTTELDGKNYDDLDDTPQCPNIGTSDVQSYWCPDYGYIMYPRSYYDYNYSSFTTEQMDVIQRYLALQPHK